MSKRDKLLAEAQESPANFRFNDLISLAKMFGFEERRQKGSHIIMVNPVHGLFMNFQNQKGKAKPYQVRQLLKAIDENDM